MSSHLKARAYSGRLSVVAPIARAVRNGVTELLDRLAVAVGARNYPVRRKNGRTTRTHAQVVGRLVVQFSSIAGAV